MLRRSWSPQPIAFFASVALFCVAKRFGNPGVQWIGSLPVLRLVNFPKYEEALLGCAVSLLAGFGVAAVMERRVSAFQCAIAAAIPLVVLTAATGSRKAAFAALAANRSYYTEALLCALLFLATVFIVATLARLNRLSGPAIGLLALVLVLGEAHAGYIVPMFYVIDGEPSQALDTLGGAPYLTFLAKQKRDGSRFFGSGILFPNWSAAFGVRDVRGVDALYDRHYFPFVFAFPAPGTGTETGSADKFVGTGTTSFNRPTVQRFLALSSVRFIATATSIGQGGIVASALHDRRLAVSPTLYGGTFTIGGESKSGVFMAPQATDLAFPATIPSDATTLRFAIGLLPGAWKAPACGDGVRFEVKVRQGSRIDRVWQRYVDPKHVASERRWLPQAIPISHYRGRDVDLLLTTATGPSGTSCMDWSVWSEMGFDGGPEARRLSGSNYRTVFRSDPVTISEFAHPLPRISLYRHVVVVRDESTALSLLPTSQFDPTLEAIVESDVANSDLAELEKMPRRLVSGGQLVVDQSRLVRATFETRTLALAVLSDTFYPGWRALLDGRPAPILRTNYLFRGVVVGPGRHVLTFEYAPRSFIIGRAVSLFSILVAIVMLVAGNRWRHVPAKSVP